MNSKESMNENEFKSPYTKQFLQALITLSHDQQVSLHHYNTQYLSPTRRLMDNELSVVIDDLKRLLRELNVQESAVRRWIVAFGVIYLSVHAPPEDLLRELLILQKELRLLSLHRSKLAALLHNNIALKYHDLEKPLEAIQEYTLAIEIEKNYSLAYYNRAITERSIERLDEALADYTKAYQLDPTDADSLNNRGSIYFQKSLFTLAAADFTKSIELDSTSPYPYYNRSLCYSETGKFVMSASDLRRANQNSPQMYTERLKNTIFYLKQSSDHGGVGIWED